ncbi:unnamed protein product [Arctogadus glacialis]
MDSRLANVFLNFPLQRRKRSGRRRDPSPHPGRRGHRNAARAPACVNKTGFHVEEEFPADRCPGVNAQGSRTDITKDENLASWSEAVIPLSCAAEGLRFLGQEPAADGGRRPGEQTASLGGSLGAGRSAPRLWDEGHPLSFHQEDKS